MPYLVTINHQRNRKSHTDVALARISVPSRDPLMSYSFTERVTSQCHTMNNAHSQKSQEITSVRYRTEMSSSAHSALGISILLAGRSIKLHCNSASLTPNDSLEILDVCKEAANVICSSCPCLDTWRSLSGWQETMRARTYLAYPL